jgi:hypothetical protein
MRNRSRREIAGHGIGIGVGVGFAMLVMVAGFTWETALASDVAPAGAAITTTRAAGSPRLTQLGHVTFWECKAKTTEMLVAVNTLTLHPGSTLAITFTVRNQAATGCNYTAPSVGSTPGATSSTLQAGPCGSVGFEVVGPHHKNVWPGVQVVHCPALGFAELAPNGTVSGTGTWNQTQPNSTARVPAGNYTLVVNDRHFSFPLRVLAH